MYKNITIYITKNKYNVVFKINHNPEVVKKIFIKYKKVKKNNDYSN